MKLHIDNLMLVAGANEEEVPLLKKCLQQWLHHNRRISLNNALEFLAELRRAAKVSS